MDDELNSINMLSTCFKDFARDISIRDISYVFRVINLGLDFKFMFVKNSNILPRGEFKHTSPHTPIFAEGPVPYLGQNLKVRLLYIYTLWILYNWLIWRVLKLAFFFQKSIFAVFILASGAVRTTPSLCRHIFMRSLIWR